MFRATTWGLLAVCSLALGSCSRQAEQTAKAPQTPTSGTIGVSLLTLKNPFFKVIGDHITSEGKKHGFTTIVVSGDEDPAKQADQVKDFIVQRVAAIVLSPCDSKTIVPVIQEANAAGIPVFTVDIPCLEPDVKIVTQITTDNFGGGREAAKAITEALGAAGGKVAILHFKQAESCQLRVRGFRDTLDQHNRSAANKIEIVAELEGGGDRDIGYRAAQDAMQAHPDLDAIFAINDPSALGAYAAVDEAGKAGDITIVGFDGQPEGKQAIKEGKIYADPIQFPDKMGIEIVNSIVAHYKGEELPQAQLIPTQLYRQEDAEKDPELAPSQP